MRVARKEEKEEGNRQRNPRMENGKRIERNEMELKERGREKSQIVVGSSERRGDHQ